jgi:hypothetical protein
MGLAVEAQQLAGGLADDEAARELERGGGSPQRALPWAVERRAVRRARSRRLSAAAAAAARTLRAAGAPAGKLLRRRR